MTSRFGSRANEPGDVYWNFPHGQNRASGNTEGIWVIQIEPNITGGAVIQVTPSGLTVTTGWKGGLLHKQVFSALSTTEISCLHSTGLLVTTPEVVVSVPSIQTTISSLKYGMVKAVSTTTMICVTQSTTTQGSSSSTTPILSQDMVTSSVTVST